MLIGKGLDALALSCLCPMQCACVTCIPRSVFFVFIRIVLFQEDENNRFRKLLEQRLETQRKEEFL
jgi:hypothetical protein